MFQETVLTLLRCTKASQEREANKPVPRPPNQRDQEIFKRVAVGGERQSSVAAELKQTKGRVKTGIQPAAVIVDHVLRALLGEDSYGLPQEPAAREIAERLLTGRTSSGDLGSKRPSEDEVEKRGAVELNRAKPLVAEQEAEKPPEQSPAASANADDDTVSGEPSEPPPGDRAATAGAEKTKSLTPTGGAIPQPPHRRQDRQMRRKLLQTSVGRGSPTPPNAATAGLKSATSGHGSSASLSLETCGRR